MIKEMWLSHSSYFQTRKRNW